MSSIRMRAEGQLSPNSLLDARYFSSSLYATGAFQTATPVLELRGSQSKSVCGLRGTVGTPEASPTDPIPAGFCSQKL